MSRYHAAHTRGWAGIRQRAIVNARRRCQRCGRPGRLEVHHPIPLSEGGTHAQPLEVVCRDCHLSRHHTDPARLAWALFLREFFPC